MAALALTYPFFPPSTPRRRVLRALFLIVVLAVGQYCFPAWTTTLSQALESPDLDHGLFATIVLLALLLGNGMLVGWLTLRYIEGRTLREIGWVRRGCLKYAVLGLVVGIAIELFLLPAPSGNTWPQDSGVSAPATLATLATFPATFMICAGLLGLVTGWMEENVFRGHLLGALREWGLSGAKANLLQAAVFALYHPVVLTLMAWLASVTHTPASIQPAPPLLLFYVFRWLLLLFGWGVLFGWLRIRTRSVVLSFCLHSAYLAVYWMVALGPVAGVIAGLAKI